MKVRNSLSMFQARRQADEGVSIEQVSLEEGRLDEEIENAFQNW